MPTKPKTKAKSSRSTKTSKKQSQTSFTKFKRLIATHRNASVAILVVLAVSLVGYYGYVRSNADSFNTQYSIDVSTEYGCKLVGRNYVDNECKTECRSAKAEYKKTDSVPHRGYCVSYVATTVDPQRCIASLHRYYVNDIGCARRANQENTNASPQCIPGYPNYVADAVIDKCVPQTIVAANTGAGAGGVGTGTPTGTTPVTPPTPSTPPSTPPATPAQPATNTALNCQLLGRKWSANKCANTCLPDSGTLLVGLITGVKYCNLSVGATAATVNNAASVQERCVTKLHRVWLVEGCARKADQKDADKAIQCQPGFPYYNANFKNLAEGKDTLNDVCETSKAAAQQNEKAGTPGLPVTVTTPPVTTPSPEDDFSGDFKIKVYQDKNFKGKELTITTDTPELPAGWNDTISSYKIIKGRWQICDDKDYKTNCRKPWASELNLDNGSKKNNPNDQITSLRPVVVTTFADAPDDVLPACADSAGNQVAAVDGVCPANSSLACSANYVLKNGECKEVVVTADRYVTVDKTFNGKNGEDKCLLLGREYIAKQKGKEANGGDYGCSMVTCNLKADGAPRNNDDKPYCISAKFDQPYAIKMDEKQCKDLHRVWIGQVGRCAQAVNREDKDQIIVAKAQNPALCTGKFTTYYIYSAKKNRKDECFTPTYVQTAQNVVKSTGGVLTTALYQGPRAYCATVKGHGYHWNAKSKRCDKDRPPKPAPGHDPATPGLPSDVAPNGASWASYCASINRAETGHCGVCTNGKQLSDSNRDAYGWRLCTQSVPSGSSVPPSASACAKFPDMSGCSGGVPIEYYDLCYQADTYRCVTISTGPGYAFDVSHPKSALVRNGSRWIVCDDRFWDGDWCTGVLPQGTTNLCAITFSGNNEHPCEGGDLYFKRV